MNGPSRRATPPWSPPSAVPVEHEHQVTSANTIQAAYVAAATASVEIAQVDGIQQERTLDFLHEQILSGTVYCMAPHLYPAAAVVTHLLLRKNRVNVVVALVHDPGFQTSSPALEKKRPRFPATPGLSATAVCSEFLFWRRSFSSWVLKSWPSSTWRTSRCSTTQPSSLTTFILRYRLNVWRLASQTVSPRKGKGMLWLSTCLLTCGAHAELEWKLTYVGSAEDEKYDQVLDAIFVGPIAIGKNEFTFEVRCFVVAADTFLTSTCRLPLQNPRNSASRTCSI